MVPRYAVRARYAPGLVRYGVDCAWAPVAKLPCASSDRNSKQEPGMRSLYVQYTEAPGRTCQHRQRRWR